MLMSIKPIFESLYTEKVTVLSKIKGADIDEKGDIWVKTIVDKTSFNTKAKSGINGSTVVVGNLITVLFTSIPNYVDYKEFIKYRGEGPAWTISLNDYVVQGVVTEDINASNITKILAKYEPAVCKVQAIEKTRQLGFNPVTLKVSGV